MMHNHDTNETFIPMTGILARQLRRTHNGMVEYVRSRTESTCVSVPPAHDPPLRERHAKGDPNAELILMFVIGGRLGCAPSSPIRR